MNTNKREMKKLTIGSFKRIGNQGSFRHYFSHILPDGKEVCLEACLSGYCVAIYNHEGGNLIGEKTCTKIEGMLESQIVSGFSILTGEALEKAVSIANKLLSTN